MTPHDDALRPLDAADDDLLAAVAAAQARFDPPPVGLVERISFAVSLELMDAELASLSQEERAGARGLDPAVTDTLTFTASTLSLMVVLSETDGGVRVDGWVTGGGVSVEARTADSIDLQVSDATGRLTWPLVPHGPLRFHIRPGRPDQRPVFTPAIEV